MTVPPRPCFLLILLSVLISPSLHLSLRARPPPRADPPLSPLLHAQALERQKEFFDSIRSERDDLREETVKLKEELKVRNRSAA